VADLPGNCGVIVVYDELNRWDCPGIACIGDRGTWDGEAEYLGLEPLKVWPPTRKAPPAKGR
jgi:hypothetical protein